MDVRPAAPSDHAGVATVAVACGLGFADSVADPSYFDLLLLHGSLVVACDSEAVGYAGAIGLGSTTMLTDLFVSPAARGVGHGHRLLEAALANAGDCCTFSSTDPAARRLYESAGMRRQWELAYLVGDAPDEPPTGWTVEPVAPSVAAAFELDVTGVDRASEYRYWSGRPGGGSFVLTRSGVAVGAGARQRARELTHLSLAPTAPQREAVLAACAGLGSGTRAHLPDDSAAASTLRELGYATSEHDLFHTTGPDPRELGLVAFAPGLC